MSWEPELEELRRREELARRIDGRRAAVQGDDFTIRGGAADAAIWEKAVYAERLAHDLRIPLVRLVRGTGGGEVRQNARANGLLVCPAASGVRPGRREPVDRAGAGGRPRPQRGTRCSPGRVLAFLG